MAQQDPTNRPELDEFSAQILSGKSPGLRAGRRVFRTLPSSPRCNLCAAPFSAPAGPLMRFIGRGPWAKNPRYCTACFKQLRDYRSGAETAASFLFADVRGSTALAETMRPQIFTGLMNRFFKVASEILIEHDAFVDKFVGDEVIGLFVPVLAGVNHAEKAIKSGELLLSATGNAGQNPWLPIGVGVHTGVAYVGTVGEGDNVDLTAMGDPVNVTARLAGAAGAGEMLVTVEAAAAAQLHDEGLERRRLELKGKSDTTDVLVVRAS